MSGEGLKYRTSYIKSCYAPKRSIDLERFWVTCKFQDGNRISIYIGKVLKIVRWSLSEESKQFFCLFVKIVDTRESRHRDLRGIHYEVDINSHPRGARDGEWVDLITSVAWRKPVMIPKIRVDREEPILYANLYDVLVSSTQGEDISDSDSE